jgi:glycosyltransferase involved in cell wall biosynthesis
MNVLALEPWYGGSHRSFLDGLVAHSRHRFETATLAARFWKWRMHGGPVTLSRKTAALVEAGFRPDVLLASGMVNLPAYLSLVRDVLPRVPVVLYFHENQLTYPLPPETPRDATYAYINYLSALTADRVVFNSAFHAREFLDALPVLLQAFPDYTHFDTVEEVRARTSVLHPGLPLEAHDRHRDARRVRAWGPGMEPPVLLWNHRWEYDKNPEAFFRLLGRLDDVGVPFRLILAGQHFERKPEGLEAALTRYAGRILHYGYAEDFDAYSRLLHRADVVVSTSRHEFFGIAMMEALYCGCHPLLPDRLSYPELIPAALHRPLLHAPVLYADDEALFQAAHSLLRGDERPLPEGTLREVAAPLDWRSYVARYDDLLEQAALAG